MRRLSILPCFLLTVSSTLAQLTTYINPIIPGYRPDPSCTAVNGTFFCISSSFNNFPGLPIYASKDLINWRHVSNVIHKEEQVPEYSQIRGQQEGVYAPTLRYRDGTFYVIVTFMGANDSPFNFIFTSTDPLDPESWGQPVKFRNNELGSFDPDIFWDHDGQSYVTVHVFDIVGNNQYPVNVTTGAYGANYNLWNGTGRVWPEGPHVYKKDDWYYLLIAKGGTGSDHSATIARSRNLRGPYDAYVNNPILTNRGTNEYFQAVGHADLFQDLAGNWWGVALSVRTPRIRNATPMGRETVLYPVTWAEGDWPVCTPVRGTMTGPLPPASHDIPGSGSWVKDGDDYNFTSSSLPLHFTHFRLPPPDFYTIRDGGLIVAPSKSNLTGGATFNPNVDRIAFIGRRQTDTLFTYDVDLDFTPSVEGEEAGVTLFLTQTQHADLGVVYLDAKPQVRFRVTAIGADQATNDPAGYERIIALPEGVGGKTVRLQIQAVSETTYEFGIGVGGGELDLVGTANATLVSGGEGSFIGSFVGVFATSNGGEGNTKATFVRWMYQGEGQGIDHGTIVPS
ncbi:putative xylan 1,4-beta-Xylosidase [Elsinoe ampelina]|uniref:Putative xylan 1,4-beta-Xylosidase n=1 Tax=Elsinoe ampelina TaxID=302913 RepID=A0A6A6GRT7_9PEZI|nr:putative xylan 1,4-beta-Xylosidase [Elsinoe ampelina]